MQASIFSEASNSFFLCNTPGDKKEWREAVVQRGSKGESMGLREKEVGLRLDRMERVEYKLETSKKRKRVT